MTASITRANLAVITIRMSPAWIASLRPIGLRLFELLGNGGEAKPSKNLPLPRVWKHGLALLHTQMNSACPFGLISIHSLAATRIRSRSKSSGVGEFMHSSSFPSRAGASPSLFMGMAPISRSTAPPSSLATITGVLDDARIELAGKPM